MAVWIGTFLVFLALAIASMCRVRFAYVTFVVLGVLWMPASASFRFAPRHCETAMSLGLAVHSMTNYKHLFLFTIFAIMTLAQFRTDDRWRFVKVAALVLARISHSPSLRDSREWRGCEAHGDFATKP